ncbi:hypothetical protein [Planobispora takensis]|uniref:hypothetical protein n=1 Tax=Planobispora takensis TaxID=1367882 RepID=UPI00366E87E1
MRRVVSGGRGGARAGKEQVADERRVRGALLPRLANQSAPDRAQYLLSPILFPIEAPADSGREAPSGSG